MEELKVKPFPFFMPKFIVLDGFPFAGQHAEAGSEREDSTERNADSNAGALWAASVAKRVSIEQIEEDIASAREALVNAPAASATDKMRRAKVSRGQSCEERCAWYIPC